MKTAHRLAALAGGTALTVSSLTALAPSAAAEPPTQGCGYPRVCFYLTMSDWNDEEYTAAFQDVTSGYQNLGSASRGADMVLNTRNDDRAYLRVTTNASGETWYMCLPPNSAERFGSAYTVTGIRIDTASSC